MKLNNAMALGNEGAWKKAQVRMSPGSKTQWFVMLHDIHSKAFILADNDDNAIATDDVNTLVKLIQSVGLRTFTVHF